MIDQQITAQVILRPDALADGYSDGQIARQRRSGMWASVRAGAYLDAPSAAGLSGEAMHRCVINATVAKLRRPAVVSHLSAAVMHGLPLWSISLGAIHVTRNPPTKCDSTRTLVCHVARLHLEDITVVDGISVTSPTRTILDLARVIGVTPAVVAADAGLHRILTTSDLLAAGLEEMTGTRGSRTAARVAHFADGRSESVGESRSRVLLFADRLPPPDLQVAVFAEGGYFLGRGDFGYRKQQVLGEFDGRIKYGRLLKPGQSAGDVLFEEKRREDALRDAGWQVARWTWADLDTPGLVAGRMRRALARSIHR